jgi:hypothetical protein
LTYVTVIVKQTQDSPENSKVSKREVKFGLCVPKECDEQEKLQFLNNIYMQGLITAGVMTKPTIPQYYFPKKNEEERWNNIGVPFYCSVGIIALLILLAFIG